MLFRNLLTKTWACWSASRNQFEAALQGQRECQADVSWPGKSSSRTRVGVGGGPAGGGVPGWLREGFFSGRWVKDLQIRPGVRSRSRQGDLRPEESSSTTEMAVAWGVEGVPWFATVQNGWTGEASA